jgi:hypothetical protein
LGGSIHVDDTSYEYNCFIAKYNSDLELINSTSTADDGSCSLGRFFVGSDGSIYVIGQTSSSSGSGKSAAILKYDSNLVLQKTAIKDGGAGYSYFTALAIGSDGSVFAAFNFDPDPWPYHARESGLISGMIIKYDNNLTECGSLCLQDIYQTFPEYLPAYFFTVSFPVPSLIADQNGFLYCVSSLESFSQCGVVVVLLDNDLSVVNSSVWLVTSGMKINEVGADLADDGSFVIVGSEVPHVGPVFTDEVLNSQLFEGAIIFK